MGSVVEFEKSTLKELFKNQLAAVTGSSVVVGDDQVKYVYDILFRSMAKYANRVKTQEKPVAVTVEDLRGNVKFAIKVSYNAEETDEAKAWTTVFTFDPEDVPADCTRYQMSEKASVIVTDVALKQGISMPANLIGSACLAMINALTDWMDENASATESVELVVNDLFTVGVDVVDGKKIFNLYPEQELINIVNKEGGELDS